MPRPAPWPRKVLGGRCSTVRSRSGRRSRRNSRYGRWAKTPVPSSGVPVSAPPGATSFRWAATKRSSKRLRSSPSPAAAQPGGGREVVVRVADDLEMLGREAVEHAEQLALRVEDVLDGRLEREQRAGRLGDREQPFEGVVQQAPRLVAPVLGRVGPVAVRVARSRLGRDDPGAELGASSRQRPRWSMFASRFAGSGATRLR